MKRTPYRLRTLLGTGMLLLCLALELAAPAAAAGEPALMPGVTRAMTQAAYWSAKDPRAGEVQAGPAELEALNRSILAAEGTGMHDLRNQPDTVNGVELAQRLKASAQADAEYYLGWTYSADGKEADQAFYDRMIANTVDPRARESQPVLLAVAVERTQLLTFPSEEPILDDPADLDFDYQNLSSIRVNEPLVLRASSADGQYYAALTDSASGWVRAEDVAVCASRDQWLAAWDIPADRALVVWGDKVWTAASNAQPETAKRMLTMGTVLELADWPDPEELVSNRSAYYNYVVYLPVRGPDGSYGKQTALLPATRAVSQGYLPLTAENIARVALGALGEPYGWGGMLESDDCSGFLRDVYRCFGLDLARNTTWQTAMPVGRVELAGLSPAEKCRLLDGLPLGTALYFKGHAMLYLGQEEGSYYVLSAASSMMNTRGTGKQRVRGVVLNTLEAVRASGSTWLQDLQVALVPYLTPADIPARTPWYYEGMRFCLDRGILTLPDGSFRAGEPASRGEIVQALWTLEGKPEPAAGENPFTDISADDPWAKAVQWARETGVAAGVTETAFRPDSGVTRQELSALLCRYARSKGMDTDPGGETLAAFTDRDQVASWALEPLRWMVGAGLLKGTSDTTLTPRGDFTRGQAAVVVMRWAGQLGRAEG